MFGRLLKQWFRPRTIQRKRSRAQLLLERLEDRCVPARFDYVPPMGLPGFPSSGWSDPSNWTVNGGVNIGNLIPAVADDVWFTNNTLTQPCTLPVPDGVFV